MIERELSHGRNVPVWAMLTQALVYVLATALCATLALPGGALAATSSTDASARGKIQIRYSKEGQSFEVYRMLDLVLYEDGESRASIGATSDLGLSADGESRQSDEYDYVIRESLSVGEDTMPNPWWTFLTTYGPDGNHSLTPYAVLSTERDQAKRSAAYFVIDAQAATVDKTGGYHVVVADRKFAMAPEVDTTKFVGANLDVNASAEESATATAEAQMVQRFVQAATAYASGLNLAREQGRYLAVGRETSGREVEDTSAGTDVYQYSGDNAYVDGVPLGYYLLGTTTGAIASLNHDGATALVYDRNEQPELFVQARAKGTQASRLPYAQLSEEERHDLIWSEDHPRTWTYRMSANVGDLVQYKTVIIATQGVTDYRLHHVMESGLTLVDDAASSERSRLYDVEGLRVDGGFDYSPRVYLYSRAADATYDIPDRIANKTNWVFHKPSDGKDGPRDGCDFEVEFRDVSRETADAGSQKMTFAYAADGATGGAGTGGGTSAGSDAGGATGGVRTVDVTDWDRIVVTYWARVNDDAVIYDSDKPVEQVETAKDLSAVMDATGSGAAKLPIQTHTDTDGNNRNTNSAVLTYGNKSHTTWARAEISSYQFDVAGATTSDDETKYPLLGGATFSLYRELGGKEDGAVAYVASVNGTNKTYYYRADEPLRFSQVGSTYTYLEDEDASLAQGDGGTAGPHERATDESGAEQGRSGSTDTVTVLGDVTTPHKASATTSLATSANEAINVRGIEAGTYVLVEQNPPEGFEKLSAPLVVTVHDRTYKNTDMMEDNNPGSRHSNVEGEITITGPSARGILARDVYPWHATCEGNPATYVRAKTWVETPAAIETEPAIVVDPEPESAHKPGEQPMTNGGVLVVNTAASASGSGVGMLGVAALLVAVIGATAAVFFVRRR